MSWDSGRETGLTVLVDANASWLHAHWPAVWRPPRVAPGSNEQLAGWGSPAEAMPTDFLPQMLELARPSEEDKGQGPARGVCAGVWVYPSLGGHPCPSPGSEEEATEAGSHARAAARLGASRPANRLPVNNCQGKAFVLSAGLLAEPPAGTKQASDREPGTA